MLLSIFQTLQVFETFNNACIDEYFFFFFFLQYQSSLD